jgi:CheY-like chemotaxis protein
MAKRILVVDDDPDTVEILAATFRKWGFEVETALNGAEAIKVLEQIPLAGMTLGIRMPRMNGHEVVRYLRRNGQRLPVIIVSGWVPALNKADEEDAYLMNNVEALFPKPVSSDELKQAVDRWIGKSA